MSLASVASVPLTATSGFTIAPTSTGTTGWSNGIWTGSVTVTGTGSTSITANDGSGHTGISNSFTVNAATLPLALDGKNSGSAASGSSFTITLTTSNPNDLLYLSIVSRSSYVTGVTSTLNNPAWSCRETSGSTIALNQGTTRYVSTWYAIQTSSGSTTLTISFNAATTGASVVVFGVSGVSTTSPFDGNVVYATDSSAGTSATVSKTTSNSNDFIIGSLALRTTNPTLTTGTGYTLIQTGSQTTNTNEVSAEYKTVSSTGTQTPGYTWTGSDDWAMIVDAIKAGP